MKRNIIISTLILAVLIMLSYITCNYSSVEAHNVAYNSMTIPSDAFKYNNNYYYVFSGKASSWEEAERYCESLGGHLAIIDDDDENEAVYNYMKRAGYQCAYFGLTDAYHEGQWYWVDGSRAVYTNWHSGEPNNDRGLEHYAMYYWGFEYTWNDGDFGKGTDRGGDAFICEWENREVRRIPRLSSANIPADAFRYGGHSYYLFSDVVNSWEEAEEYCEALGGHLVIIEDDYENKVIYDYMTRTGYKSAYIGLTDAGHEGQWYWVDGRRAVYTNWHSGEPNDERGIENYAMYYWKFEYTWNDGDFGKGTDVGGNAFICEWDF